MKRQNFTWNIYSCVDYEIYHALLFPQRGLWFAKTNKGKASQPSSKHIAMVCQANFVT